MPLHSTIDTTSQDFARNAEAMRALVAELRGKLDQVAGGGGKVSRARHTARGMDSFNVLARTSAGVRVAGMDQLIQRCLVQRASL